MKISRRSRIPSFAVMDVLAAARARRAAGQDVIDLCAGEPEGGAGEPVRRRAARLLTDGDLGYTPALGLPELRRAIAGHYRRWYGLDPDPGQVAVTTGSSGGFVLAFLAAFDVGDRVALARPGYPAYRNILRALGCEVVEIPCGAATRYQPTVAQLEALAGSSVGVPDGLVLASPSNPTGTMIPAAELEALAAWCRENGVRLVSDEIYHGIDYGERAATAAGHLAEGAVVVNSFSKYWAMTGWRLGWLLLPEDLVAPVDALAGNVALCPPALSQHAALAAFDEASYAAAEENVARYAENRALLLGSLDRLGWSAVAPADGAFYLYADVAGSGLDSVTYCRRLLDEAGVALTPGTDFDAVDGRRWVRLSFAVRPETVARAVERIADWRTRL